jgi:2-deoxy-D-gluconate 3-dehydrogenase
VEMMTKTLALELAPFNINVNALAPGPTWVRDGEAPPLSAQNQFNNEDPLSRAVGNRIERLPLGHWGDPMEQGKAAVFLASEMSAFVTGAYLPCDGGWLAL